MTAAEIKQLWMTGELDWHSALILLFERVTELEKDSHPPVDWTPVIKRIEKLEAR